jgi:hypothetical protein
VTSVTVLAARGFVAGLAVAVLAGCGGRPRTDLSITVSNAFGQHEYQLTCDPDGGDKILAEKLCALLNETPDVMLAGPTSSSCAGGLATVHLHVQGMFDGRSVDTANGIDSCSGNLEAEQLWLSGLPLPPQPASS